MDKVWGTIIQAQGPMYILTMVWYIKDLVTYHLERVLVMVKLGTLLDHALILVVNRYTHRVYLPQLLNQYSRHLHSFIRQCFLSKITLSLRASRSMVQEVDLVRDLLVEDMYSLLHHNRKAEDRFRISLLPLRMLRHPI